MNNIKDVSGLINLKLKQPTIKKIIFVAEIEKFVKKIDLVFSKII